MIEPCYIYAFKCRNKFLYVGQSVDPEYRKFFHTCVCSSKIKKKLPKSSEFVILRKTSTEHSYRIERQVIRSLKKRGQCKLNKNNGCRTGQPVGGDQVEWNGMTFISRAQFERYLKSNNIEATDMMYEI